MSPTDTARVQPSFGADELRVYRFSPDQADEPADSDVWVCLSAQCVSARCRLTPAEARTIAAGMVAAADAAEGVAHVG